MLNRVCLKLNSSQRAKKKRQFSLSFTEGRKPLGSDSKSSIGGLGKCSGPSDWECFPKCQTLREYKSVLVGRMSASSKTKHFRLYFRFKMFHF